MSNKNFLRRYDINKNNYLTLEEARELCFCFAAFLKNLPRRSESPESEDLTPEIESYGEEVHNEADTTLDSESEIEDEVDGAPSLPPIVGPTPEEKEAIVKDKNVIGHINGEMAEILLDFVTTADETLNDDCKFSSNIDVCDGYWWCPCHQNLNSVTHF